MSILRILYLLSIKSTTAISGAEFPTQNFRRGTWRVLNGVPAIATHHPNEVLRLSAQGARSAKLEVWNVLKLALARLGKTPPAINKKG